MVERFVSYANAPVDGRTDVNPSAKMVAAGRARGGF
jgi:hypothetical protein